MIVRIHSAGKSFKGLATYLTHDPKANTEERVGWTHTINLANDHVPSAVDEMLWTARSAELLKQEAGLRAGGRATDNALKHVSLNWAPEQNPTREHMIETAEDFLRAMKWHEHQAVLVAHEDKDFAHVHLMISTIHPETGLHLDDNFERRRAQKWALGYELESGHVYCEQRLHEVEARDEAPTRPVWMAFQKKHAEFNRDEKARRDDDRVISEAPQNPGDVHSAEWKELKAILRQERLDFFSEGKAEFSELRRSIYQEVREEFRERWADYFALQKQGGDPEALKDLKKKLVSEQTELLERRRDAACAELKVARDGRYRDLLDDQRDIRQQMSWRQENGLDNTLFLSAISERHVDSERPIPAFGDAAAARVQHAESEREEPLDYSVPRGSDRAGIRSGADIGESIATGLGFGFLSFMGGIADGLIGATPQPEPQQVQAEFRFDPFEGVVEEARRRQRSEQDDADEEYRKKQRSADGE
jgi:hypothetical protein